MLFVPIIAQAQYDVSLTEIADGYLRPAEIVNAGDERLFIAEQPGKIHILYTDGIQESQPFLDISDRVDAQGTEKGLLGLAFPPDYCASGVFYVNYTHTDGQQLKTRISRFMVDPENENHALASSEQILLTFNQPFSNHNGGHLEFGPDGYLYIATGDGGDGGDPNNNAQNLQSFLGKILRINVSGPTPETPYTIPPDNPFVENPDALDEIWAYGLRNPWKFAFDSETGELYIGDVGQSNREEIDYVPADSPGGFNFGWRCYEGTEPYDLSECDGITNFTPPIFDYAYGNSPDGYRCSNTGGRVYRGPSFTALTGKFIDVDYCSGEYWLLWQENGEWQHFHGTNLGTNIVAFGSDIWGEMYAVGGSNGKIYRVEEASGVLQPPIILLENDTIKSTLAGTAYVWFLNGSEIPGASSQAIPISESGDYSVQITTESGCVVTTPIVNIEVSNIQDHALVTKFEVFPNPSNGIINLKIQIDKIQANQVHLIIYDLSGKRVFTADSLINYGIRKIDLSMLPDGMYFLYCRLEAGEVLAVRKVVID